MGGFKYKNNFQSEFVNGARKDQLIKDHEAFEITKSRLGKGGDYGPQYYLSVRFQDDTEGVMTFTADGTVFTRDDLLEQLTAYLKDSGDSVIAYLRKEGQTNLLDIEETE